MLGFSGGCSFVRNSHRVHSVKTHTKGKPLNWKCEFSIYCPIALSGAVNGNYKGTFTGFFDAFMKGSLDANFQGTIIGVFHGTIVGDFCGHLDGEFHGQIGGVQFDGDIDQDICTSINGTFNGTINGDFGGHLTGTFNGHLTGNFDGYIDAFIHDGTLTGDFGGTIDGIPTDTDYPFPNLTREPPDVPGGFEIPPFVFDFPPSGGVNPGPGDPPADVLVNYLNNEQSYTITCPDLSEYTAVVPANLYSALTQAVADQMALDAAQGLAQLYCDTGSTDPLVQGTPQTCIVTCASGSTSNFTSTSFGVTLEEANANAMAYSCQMAQLTCSPLLPPPPGLPPGGTGPGGGLPPITPPTPPPTGGMAYTNSDQTVTVDCPNGGTFSYTTKAGQFFVAGTTPAAGAAANAMALSYALDQAMTLRFCFALADNRGNQGFHAISDFRIAINESYAGALITLERTGVNTLYDFLYTFTVTGAPPWQPSAFIPPPGVVILGAAPEWTFQYGSATERAVAITAGQYATIFTITQDRPTYRIMATRTMPWYVGQIATDSQLPDASVGGSYNEQLLTEFMLAPFDWRLADGSDPLPDGLTLNANGTITGTPTTEDTVTIDVEVTDAAYVTTHKQFDISVVANCISSTSPLSSGAVGTPYSVQLLAPGLTAPLNWTNTGALPGGLTLNQETGFITGTPTTAANTSFQANVIDDNNVGCNKVFSITIAATSGGSCGFWNDFPLANQDDPVNPGVVAETTPEDLEGVTEFNMSLQVPQDAPDVNTLSVAGTKSYTGGALAIKVILDVTTFETGLGEPADISVYFMGALIGQVSAVGTYEFLGYSEESIAQDIEFSVIISRNPQFDEGTIEADVTLISCASTVGASDGFRMQTVAEFGSLYRYVATGAANPSATITLTSNKAVTWDIGSYFAQFAWAVSPTITLDGVPLTLHDVGGGDGWALDISTVDTDLCVVRTFQISGGTVNDPTDYGAISFAPQT